MVKIMENPYFLMDDLGGKPTIFGSIHLCFILGVVILLIRTSKVVW